MHEGSPAGTELSSLPVREGELLAGKYRIGHVLGVGGMGVVVSARHEQLDQRVAIKFVRGGALGNTDAVERFLREARAAAKLRSEHAARVLDVGTLEGGAPYMVMELLEGSDLAQVLEERGPVPVELAADWVIQACEAVAEAHAAGIVHRDLKPQNLFLALTMGGATKIKVLDFGVAKSMVPVTGVLGALTRTRATLGSPLYMAPEQMRSSRDVDARADVWALGVVIFELLTRRFPFEAETIPELCLKVVTDPPLSLSDLRPDVAQAMVDVVERCLAKERAHRFANAAELASALEPFAPPGAAAIVSRAQMAMASAASVRPFDERVGPSGTALHGRSPAEPRGRMVRTPAAWGSRQADAKGAQSLRRRKRSLFFWIALGLACMGGVGAVVGSAVLAHRSAATGGPASASSIGDRRAPVSSAVVAPANAPDPVFATSPANARSTPVSSSAPADADRLTPLATPAVSVTARPEQESPAAAVIVPSAKPTPPPTVNRPPSPARPPPRDDDIPSLR